MKHSCDTARSGSERSENTCAACAWERDNRRRLGLPVIPSGVGDITAEWLRQTAAIGAKKDGKCD